MCRTQKMRRYGQEAIMGLYTLRELLIPASAGEYAVGSFNFFGLENLQGILLQPRSCTRRSSFRQAREQFGI